MAKISHKQGTMKGNKYKEQARNADFTTSLVVTEIQNKIQVFTHQSWALELKDNYTEYCREFGKTNCLI